jgi:TonB family protein
MITSMTTHRITIFDVQKEKLGVSLFYSFITHCLLLGSFFYLPHYINPKPVMWGDSSAGGGAISVGIVQKIGGLNLPRPELSTENIVATESKGLGQTEVPDVVKQPLEIPDPKAFEIQEKKKKPEPKKPEAKKSEAPAKKVPRQIAKVQPPPNVVPFGEGGAPNFSYSQFQIGSDSGGIGLGEGIFGEKYGWYVRQIRDIVSGNWQKNLIDPNVRSAPRLYIQFDILRDGSVANEFVKQSSGIASLDRSGLRAVRASHFPPLPGGETRLTVEFWFEHSR